jgi:para-aminobenzoate synthetase/4-amino-4-deoxychorismate lyase
MQSHRNRPDERQGVFETMLVLDGRPVELAAHMARLRASLQALFGADVPPGAEDRVTDGARGIGVGRLRLTIAPGDPRLTADVTATPVDPAIVFPAFRDGARLKPISVPGGWGPHKWADRGPLAAGEGNGSVPLVLDHDGTVLEGSRANVFIVEGGTIVTPPADGRILPGVTRARLLELLGAREEVIPVARLVDADEVFLSGSVRGVEPVTACAGGRVWEDGPVARATAEELRRHWEGEQ